MDLIGIPHRLVIGDKGLAKDVAEYKGRRDAAAREVVFGDIANEIGRLVRC
jgi:prolyl-tRNA synthetase